MSVDKDIKKLKREYYDTKYDETITYDVSSKDIVDKINEIIDAINKKNEQ